MNVEVFCFDAVAPVRERGLKYDYHEDFVLMYLGRSRKGAWIEISSFSFYDLQPRSLP